MARHAKAGGNAEAASPASAATRWRRPENWWSWISRSTRTPRCIPWSAGSFLGPSLIGFGLSAGFTQAALFAVTAIPAFVSCLLVPVLWLGEMASAGDRKGASGAH